MTTFRTALSDAWFVTTVIYGGVLDAWNTATELAGAWLARQDEKAASALGGSDD